MKRGRRGLSEVGGGGSHIHRRLIIRVKTTRPSLTQRDTTEVQTVKRRGPRPDSARPRGDAVTEATCGNTPVEGQRTNKQISWFQPLTDKGSRTSRAASSAGPSKSDPSPYPQSVRCDPNPPPLMQLATLAASVATLSQSTTERSARNA